MDTEMVVPFRLHRVLDRAQALNAGERINVLEQVLNSGIFAVIRRIPQVMSPFSDEEKEMIVQWASNQAKDTDVSDRDFAFHLMANCKVSAERILAILKENRTFSRGALEHIQQALDTGESTQQLNHYLYEVADELLKGREIRPRDRGRHMLMTLARTEDDWQILAKRFSGEEIPDLRQRVIERFLRECPDGTALRLFADNVVMMCLECIRNVNMDNVGWLNAIHKEASHMHWVLMCLERLGPPKGQGLMHVAVMFKSKFGDALPRSVRWKIEPFLPVVLVRPVMPAADVAVFRGAPVRKSISAPVETNAQIAARLGITKRQAAKLRARGELPDVKVSANP